MHLRLRRIHVQLLRTPEVLSALPYLIVTRCCFTVDALDIETAVRRTLRAACESRGIQPRQAQMPWMMRLQSGAP